MFGFLKKNKQETFRAPFDGRVIKIEDVKDPAFSGKMLGDGVAVEPSNNVAVAPCDGKLVNIFPTNHAFCIVTDSGLEVLVHIGMDTVALKGEGFKRLVEPGGKVKAGTPIMEVDFELLKEKEKDIITPVVITNMNIVEEIQKDYGNIESMMTVVVKK